MKLLNLLKKNIIFFIVSVVFATIDILSKYLIFISLKAIIFVPVFMFSMDSQNKIALNHGYIPKKLQDKIHKHNHKIIAKDSLIRQYSNKKEWWIQDKNQRYFLKESENKIEVYKPLYNIPSKYYQITPMLFIPYNYKHYKIIPNFFSIRVAFNQGAVFSSFTGKTMMLTIASIIAIIFILIMILKNEYSITHKMAFGLITSGAVGNLWDRFLYGGVRDFLDCYVGKWHWPTFNLADCFILTGIGLFLIMEWGHSKDMKKDE